MRKTHVPVLLLLVLFPIATNLLAEDRTLLVSGVFADSSIIGPVLRFSSGDADTSEYSLTLLGGTLDAQWVKHHSRRQAWLFSADATPFNAHLSNRIYVEGQRAHDLEYEAACYRLRAGVRFAPNQYSTTDIQLVGLLEQVADMNDARVRNFWEGPFLGVDAVYSYKRVTSESPLVASLVGVVATAKVEAYAGPETWSRASVSIRSGFQKGRAHFRQSVMLTGGSGFNVVNRLLVGGSWDVLGETALYGHRYGEYRVARGVIANLGADYPLPKNWRVGVRGSYLRSDIADVHGTAFNASKTWKTIGLNFGIGIPQSRNGESEPVFYMAAIAPLYAK